MKIIVENGGDYIIHLGVERTFYESFKIQNQQPKRLTGNSIIITNHFKDSVQFSLVAQACLTLCNPMNCSTPGLPVHHQLLEFTQTHVHRVCDAIQPSHPLSFLSPPAPNPSQHQGLFPMSQHFAWGGQNTGVSALASFFTGLISFRMDWLDLLAVQGTRKTNYLGINLPKETKDIYIENYKTLMKEIKDDTNRWRIYLVHGSEESL